MLTTLKALLASRKFWTGTLTLAAVAMTTYLRKAGLLDADQVVPTIGAITTVGIAVIASTAWEDAASKGSSVTNNVPGEVLVSALTGPREPVEAPAKPPTDPPSTP